MADAIGGKINGVIVYFKDKVARAMGLPSGGTAGQILKKKSATDYDAEWSDTSVSTHYHAASDITSGTLGVARGGTGKATHTANAVLTGDGTNAFKNVATASGAFYATAANGAPSFGTLPIAQGGTGKTTAADAWTALGGGAVGKKASLAASDIPALSTDKLTSGTLGVARGGTGKATHTSNAVLTGNGTNAVNNVATASGALYATAANGTAKFGTLPIAQGGTGQTTAALARNALGLGNTTGALPIANGGTGKTTAADARTALGITAIATHPDYTYSTTDLTDGSSALATGKLYFYYEA